ncbi:leader peptidase (prepilin peptidase) / N-methyltransferase [Halolactibacillus halophilus]|uniref:Leader peptidase (Prepilin peptidase) / N-methyltransferase n=1 Tax=Halolactibacillus halophilus TaxID=306540 RepID=A0A1I5L184_9BACI|nr:A24 family peptidase [Halolactibacillus halophilus]GEM00595.1 type 4 prepilin-like proteins leader peptide-processing enzyme [Halolactibacillus halophilus]SFO90902.1 leader peptidase (prepilin peptidase) / N-methyltransferase [Halolactibacillus halophilus]
MTIFYSITFFIFGLVLGSFYNVVGLRVPKNNFLSNDRSYCPTCHKQLSAIELIPVVSYVSQRGKCRGCGAKISAMYPLIELLTGVGFLFSYLVYGLTMEAVIAVVAVSLSVIIIVTDLTYFLIPNKILLFFFPLIVILRFIEPLDPWYSSLVGALIGFGLIFVVILLSQGGMGAGDMKYFFVLGYLFGIGGVLLIFLLSTLYGTLINIVLLLRGKVTRKTKVPFGPYISMAALTVIFFGESILTWYFSFF